MKRRFLWCAVTRPELTCLMYFEKNKICLNIYTKCAESFQERLFINIIGPITVIEIILIYVIKLTFLSTRKYIFFFWIIRSSMSLTRHSGWFFELVPVMLHATFKSGYCFVIWVVIVVVNHILITFIVNCNTNILAIFWLYIGTGT